MSSNLEQREVSKESIDNSLYSESRSGANMSQVTDPQNSMESEKHSTAEHISSESKLFAISKKTSNLSSEQSLIESNSSGLAYDDNFPSNSTPTLPKSKHSTLPGYTADDTNTKKNKKMEIKSNTPKDSFASMKYKHRSVNLVSSTKSNVEQNHPSLTHEEKTVLKSTVSNDDEANCSKKDRDEEQIELTEIADKNEIESLPPKNNTYLGSSDHLHSKKKREKEKGLGIDSKKIDIQSNPTKKVAKFGSRTDREKHKSSRSTGSDINSSSTQSKHHKHASSNSSFKMKGNTKDNNVENNDSYQSNTKKEDTAASVKNISPGGQNYLAGLARGQSFRESRQSFDISFGFGGIGIGTGISSGSHRETTSFLETLSVDEKRTMTRHLPDVEGFRRLHKSEIKSDLKVARSQHSFQPELFSKHATKLDKKGEFSTLESGKSILSQKTLIDIIPDDEEYYNDIDEPVQGMKLSSPFIVPEVSSKISKQASVTGSISSGGEGDETLSSGNNQKQNNSRNAPSTDNNVLSLTSPKVIESITAFNPPRPPESNGPKKRNRLLRWERNPHEVEIDLDNYKKTVERTQEELDKAEKEREKLEILGATFRDHFMTHLRLLREESIIVNREFHTLQMECLKLSDKLTSGANTKNCSAIGDILSKLFDKNNILPSDYRKDIPCEDSFNISGIGGVSACNQNQMMDGHAPAIASGWILPGNKVKTAYGIGTVVDVFGVSFLNGDTHSINKDIIPNSYNGTLKNASNLMPPKNKTQMKRNQKAKIMTKNKGDKLPDKNGKNLLSKVIPPRVCIRLSFGFGYFAPDQMSVIDTISNLTNSELISRWRNFTQTAFLMKDCVDTNAMESKYLSVDFNRTRNKRIAREKSINSQVQDTRCKDMDIEEDKGLNVNDEDVKNSEWENVSNMPDSSGSSRKDDEKVAPDHHVRVMPFGRGMISGSGYSGSAILKIPANYLEEAMGPILFNGTGVLGKVSQVQSLHKKYFAFSSYLTSQDNEKNEQKSNPSLNSDMKYWEEKKYELFQLKGQLLQLRNELFRQERARRLNEQSRSAIEGRTRLVENLFIEMKADLNSLKERLGYELSDLGTYDVFLCHL